MGAGAGALIATHPLDTVRTRLASARVFAQEVPYSGPFDCFRTTLRLEGLRGLYAGCIVSIFEIAPYSAIAFAGYEGAKARIETRIDGAWMPTKILAGLASGASATTCCYPLDTLRRQLMLDDARGFEARYQRSFAVCFVSLWRKGGIRRLYRGWSVTMLKSVPTVSITFVTNDFLRTTLAAYANKKK